MSKRAIEHKFINNIEHKYCNKCGQWLTLNEFHRDKTRKDGFHCECKKCSKNYKLKNLKNTQKYKMEKNYNLTLEHYNQMLEAQNSVCAICGKEETSIDKRNGKIRFLAVDHCHETGQIRGLLCGKCNTAIGLLQEDIENLEQAILYLQKYKKLKIVN